MRWPWARKRDDVRLTNVGEPYAPLVQWAGAGAYGGPGLVVGERTTLTSSAFYRALSLISQQLAMLPLDSFTGSGEAPRRVASIFDDPDSAEGQTPFEWKETAFLHLLLYGRAGAIKLRTAAGGLGRLALVHPLSWRITEPTPQEYAGTARFPVGGLWFWVSLKDGTTAKLDADGFWFVPGPTSDGVNCNGLLDLARQSISTTLAGDRAASKIFSKGALIGGIAMPADDDVDITDDVPEMRRQIDAATSGAENAGAIALINRRLNITPWTMTAADAQFLQSRQFQVEEVARWTGVPPHLLMQTEKQTSWGTGVEEQNRALGRTVLGSWATRFEQRASRLLANPRYARFDFGVLERPSPEKETDMLIKEIGVGLLTLNEARAIRGRPAVAGGDTARGAQAAPALEGGAEDDPAAE